MKKIEIIDFKKGKDGVYSPCEIKEDKGKKDLVKVENTDKNKKFKRPKIERIVYKVEKKNIKKDILEGFQEGLNIIQKFAKLIDNMS